MNFIYTLSVRGKVFYIGCTKTPVLRFWNHMTGHTPATRAFIYNNLVAGRKPVLNIIGHSKDRKEALKLEAEFIKKHPRLLNSIHSIYKPKKIQCESFYFSFKFKYDKQAILSFTKYYRENIKPIPMNVFIDYKNTERHIHYLN